SFRRGIHGLIAAALITDLIESGACESRLVSRDVLQRPTPRDPLDSMGGCQPPSPELQTFWPGREPSAVRRGMYLSRDRLASTSDPGSSAFAGIRLQVRPSRDPNCLLRYLRLHVSHPGRDDRMATAKSRRDRRERANYRVDSHWPGSRCFWWSQFVAVL